MDEEYSKQSPQLLSEVVKPYFYAKLKAMLFSPQSFSWTRGEAFSHKAACHLSSFLLSFSPLRGRGGFFTQPPLPARASFFIPDCFVATPLEHPSFSVQHTFSSEAVQRARVDVAAADQVFSGSLLGLR